MDSEPGLPRLYWFVLSVWFGESYWIWKMKFLKQSQSLAKIIDGWMSEIGFIWRMRMQESMALTLMCLLLWHWHDITLKHALDPLHQKYGFPSEH